MKLYKVLGKNGEAMNGGNGKWRRNGKWMPAIEGDLIPCKNGYHLCRREDLLDWLGPTIWEAEYRGEIVESYNKVVVREARITKKLNWDDTAARLFAIDCAEHTMHLGDEVIISSILAIVYLYAIGEAAEEDRAAAQDAAWDAAWDVAQTAAWDVAQAAARDVAQDAARDAARGAARTAAWDVAQAAARAAAWDAAWEAARTAAREAAWGAVWDAAWGAEREWQIDRLFEYLQAGGE